MNPINPVLTAVVFWERELENQRLERLVNRQEPNGALPEGEPAPQPENDRNILSRIQQIWKKDSASPCDCSAGCSG